MQQVCLLTILHFVIGRTSSVHNTNRIPIDHSAICHESFKVWMIHKVPCHDNIQAHPKLHLDLGIFRMYVTYCNVHHFFVLWIVHMASHSGPILYTLHVSNIIHAFWRSRLHMFHEIHTTSRSLSEHLQNIHFLLPLPKINTIVNVFESRLFLHGHDVIDDTSLVD